MKIGHGIFTWNGSERRNRRYGAFYAASNNYNQDVEVRPYLDIEYLKLLIGKRVLIHCVVTESRDSGHAGDAFLGIKPSRPQVGETVILGVGVLQLGDNGADEPTIILQPSDGRKELWIDPRKLYLLHDQTVDIYVDATDAPESPRPDLEFTKAGVIANRDGTLQYSGVQAEEGDRLLPTVEDVGDGLFEMRFPKDGERAEIRDRVGRRKS